MQPQTMNSLMKAGGFQQFSLQGEQWKPSLYGDGRYFISNLGRIITTKHRGHDTTALMNPAEDGCGYLRTVFFHAGKYRTVKVHRLVAETWVAGRILTPEETVNHKNCSKQDNRAENLEIMTRAENIRHGAASGKYGNSVGSINGNSKLTEEMVERIRKEYIPKKVLQRELAEKYGVSRNTIMRVLNGKAWKHTISS